MGETSGKPRLPKVDFKSVPCKGCLINYHIYEISPHALIIETTCIKSPVELNYRMKYTHCSRIG